MSRRRNRENAATAPGGLRESLSQGQYWAGRTPPPNNRPRNMAAANFIVITNGEGCALNGTAVAAVFIDQ